MKNYIGIIENQNMIKAYAWYSYITRIKINLYGESSPRLKNFLKQNIVFRKDVIGTYHGKYYEIQRYMVCDSDYIEKLKIQNNSLLKFQNKIFKSQKVINYYKQYYSNIEYKLLRDKALGNELGTPYCFVLPRLHSYKILSKLYLKENEYNFSWILTLLFVLYAIIKFAGSILKMLLVKPVFIKKQKGLVLKKLAWGFGGKGLKDDILIDNINISKNDMIFFYDSSTKKKNDKPHADFAKENGYKVVSTDRSFNINECYLKSIKKNIFFAALSLLYSLIHTPFLLFALKSFNAKTFHFFKLFSFVNVKYFWSVGNWHDIAETIVANNQQVRAFMYSWSDYAQHYLYTFTFTVHDDVFMWGPIEEKYMIHKSLHENMFTIGCLFSNNFVEINKEEVFEKLNLNPSKPVVVFYDSPISNEMRFPQSLFDQFRKIILIVDQKYSNIQIVLKPKTVTHEYREYFHGSSVNLLDGNDVYLGDIINISTLNIGMGIVAPITISLIMNKPGIFFDTAGNYDTPFAKYEGELVFRDQVSLLNKIDQILTNQFTPIVIDELKYYNVARSNPVEILREYVTTGKVGEAYRLY